MKKILSLCINLLLLIISEAVPLKLIAGDRSVVKKDGATHTISKYYVVPNDFNPNNVTNNMETSQTTLRMNHSLYSKSMDAGTATEHQVSEKRAEAANNQTNEINAVNNNEVNLRSDFSDVNVDLVQADDNTAQSMGSVNTEENLGSDDPGNLQVKPIANFTNVSGSVTTNEVNVYNSSEALQNGTLLTVENTTQTFRKDFGDELDDLILTKFGFAVHESSVQNRESYWKLIKLNIDSVTDDDELLKKIEKLSLLLNIFTNLYEAAQSQKPVESMIDSIIDILEIPFVEVNKRNTNESQCQTDVTGDYDEECFRKCCQKCSKPQLGSNGTYLSKTKSKASDNLELKNLDLQRRHRGDSDNGDDRINTSNDPGSDQVAVTNQPSNILRSQLVVPYNLNVGVPDGYNVRSSITMPTLNHVPRENDVQEDPTSNQRIPGSAEINEHLDDQPLTMKTRLTHYIMPWTIEDKSTKHLDDQPLIIESKLADNILPWTIEDKSTKNLDDQPLTIESKLADNILPWTIEDKSTKNLDDQPLTIESKLADNIMPWHIEDKTTDNLPWHIEDKTSNHQPWIIEHITTNTLPWTIADRGTKKLPWKVENRADPNWTIENKMGHLKKILYQSRYPSIITYSGKNLLHPNPPPTGTVHSVKHGVKKPYHIYTYVINPATSLYEIPTSGNIVNVKSRQPNANLETKLYGMSTSHGGNKIVYANQPSPSYYESQFSSSKPSVDINSQINNTQLKHTNHDTSTYDTSNEVNLSDLLSERTQDDNQPKYLVGHEPETNHKAVLLLPNTLHSDSETNSDQENEVPQVPEVGSHPGVLLPNVPSTPFESLINLGNTEPVSPASAETSDVKSDIGDTETNPYNPNINLNRIQQTNLNPGVIAEDSYYSEYTNLPDEYGGQTHQHPTLITSSASSSSAYPNLPDEYDEPQHPALITSSAPSSSAYPNLPDEYYEPQHPNLITSSASSSSAYPNLPDEYDESFYSGQTQQHPGVISKASADSEYTNRPNDYNNPIPNYGQHTDRHPGLITKVSHYPEYATVEHGYDEPIPIYGGQIHKHPGFISKTSSHSEYTNLLDEYDEPVYVIQTHQHPGLISSSASSNSEYKNVVDDYDEPSSVYGGETHKYSGFISKASADSEYTNLPNDYNNPIPNYGQYTDRHPGLITKVIHYPEYATVEHDYDEPIPIYGGQIQKHPGFISKASSHSEYSNLSDEYDEPVYVIQTPQHPGLISSSASSYSEYPNLPDEYDESFYSGQTQQHPGVISKASDDSEYINPPNDYNNPIPNYGQHTDRNPGLITKVIHYPEIATVEHDYDEPTPLYGGQIQKHPGFISKASSHSEYTNLPDAYDEPVYVIQTHQHPGLISSSASSNSEYTNVVDDYNEPSSVYWGETHKYPGFISKASADSEYTNRPNDYNNPIPNYGQHTDRHPGLITEVIHHPEYATVEHEYDEPIPIYGGQIHKHPGFISKTSSHSEYTNLLDEYDEPVYVIQTHQHPGLISSSASSNSEYTNIVDDYDDLYGGHIQKYPTFDYEADTDGYPVHIQTPVNGKPTKSEDNLPVSYHPYGQKIHIVQPSLIAHLHGNHPTGLNYLKHLKLAPTYRLFTMDNLLKLHDAVIKTIEVNGDEPDIYDNKGLINLRKIINIILILAKHLEEPEGSIEWYENIFYNTQTEYRHPLEIYVYNLIRQRWLHELMLVLHKNNFKFNILQNPRLFSFLGSWQFPNYVLKFMETEELLQHNFDAPKLFDQTFSSQYGLQDQFATHTYDDVLEEVPENLENYVTNNVIESYKTPNAGIVLSIAGVDAEPDANAIIHILQKYLHYKSFIEKQENDIIRDNKVETLKRIILFLREKGYDAYTIADLIRKLHTVVYSKEGKGCQTHHTNFAKNMYDVILPVLRRSGR